MSYLLVYWRRYRKMFFIAIFFLTIEACCDLMQPTIASKIIDNGVKAKELSYVLRLSCSMLMVALLGAVCAVVRSQLASRVSQHFGADLRFDLYKKVSGFSFQELGKHQAATLITRMTNDTTQLQNFANGMMRIFVKAPILFIGSFIMVILLNPRLIVILAAVAPVITLIIFISMKAGFPLFAKMQALLDKNNSVIREYLSGVRVVKAFNTFDFEVGRFEESNAALSDVSIKANRVMSVFMPIITFIVNMSIVYLLWTAGPNISSGKLQVGQVVAFINYISQLLMSLTMIFNVYQQFIRAKASAERVSEVLGATGEESAGDVQPDNLSGEIEFKNVTFSYPGTSGRPVISNVSFKIMPMETVGIIGSTGSGKTTLVNLIPGFYSPTEGEVKIDGKLVGEYNQESLRERISMIAQTALLFTGTIEENIRWGKNGATREKIEEAAKAAQAHGFISSFPDGYGTVLGQGGVNLSGGQKQRVSIARAIVRNPKILILDDCVSAVDVETEAAILQAINKVSKGLTCIMISQRVSSVMNLSKIIVLDDGVVVGCGPHKELIKNCAVYREICRSQLGRGESDERNA